MTSQPPFPNSTSQTLANQSPIVIPSNTLAQSGFIISNNAAGGQLTTASGTGSQQTFMFAPGALNGINNGALGQRAQFVNFVDGTGMVAYSANNIVASPQVLRQSIANSAFNQILPNNIQSVRPIGSTQSTPQQQQQHGSTIFMSPIVNQANVQNQIIANNSNQQQFAFAPALATFSMLPNGQICLSQNQNITQQNIGQPTIQPAHKIQTVKPATNNTGSSKKEHSPAEVLKQLEVQIANISGLAQPTETQKKRLKELTTVRDKLIKATNNRELKCGPDSTPSDKDESSNDSSLIKKPVINPTSSISGFTVTHASRIDILNKLQSNFLLPKCALGTSLPDTFIVEFRMTNQRFQLRMTHQQKENMEKLLYSQTPIKQAEILTIFQQEQSKIPVMNHQAATVNSPQHHLVTTNQQNLLRPNLQPLKSQQITTAGALSANATSQQQQSFFINGQQIAFTPTGTNCQGQGSFHFIPTSQHQQGHHATAGSFQCTPIVSSNAAASPINTPGRQQYFQLPINMASPSQANVNALCIRQPIIATNTLTPNTFIANSFNAPKNITQQRIPLTPQQSHALMEFRNLYATDVNKLSTFGQMMGVKMSSDDPLDVLKEFSHYHVTQDHDNSEEALEKTDTILEEALQEILKRKSSTIQSIHEITFCCEEIYNGFSSERLDSYLVNKLTLEMEQEEFSREKDLYERITNSILEAEKTDLFIDPSDDRFHDFTNLEFKHDLEKVFNAEEFCVAKPRNNMKRRHNGTHSARKANKSKTNPLEPYRRFLGPLVDYPFKSIDEKGNFIDVKTLNLPSVNDILTSWKSTKDQDEINGRLIWKRSVPSYNNVDDDPVESAINASPNPPSTPSDKKSRSENIWDELEDYKTTPISQRHRSTDPSQLLNIYDDTSQNGNYVNNHNEDTSTSFSSTVNPKSSRDDDEMALMRTLEETANCFENNDGIGQRVKDDEQNQSFSVGDEDTTNPMDDEVNSSTGLGIHSEDPDIDAAIRSILSPSL